MVHLIEAIILVSNGLDLASNILIEETSSSSQNMIY